MIPGSIDCLSLNKIILPLTSDFRSGHHRQKNDPKFEAFLSSYERLDDVNGSDLLNNKINVHVVLGRYTLVALSQLAADKLDGLACIVRLFYNGRLLPLFTALKAV